MKIISIGYDFKHGKEFSISRPYGLKEYLLLIIRSTADFCISGQKMQIMPNSMILIDKNMPHSFSANSDCFINDWIAFTVTPNDYLYNPESMIKLNVFFTSPDVLICSDLIKLICAEDISTSNFREMNMQNMMQIIFNKLCDHSKACKTNIPYHDELQKIRNYIYQNPTEKYTIERLAAEINLSKSYFQHCYKQCFDTSPIADAITGRIEYSKQLLMSTNYPISKIADMIGYKNDIQFIKQFKAIVKKTPLQYKKDVISD